MQRLPFLAITTSLPCRHRTIWPILPANRVKHFVLFEQLGQIGPMGRHPLKKHWLIIPPQLWSFSPFGQCKQKANRWWNYNHRQLTASQEITSRAFRHWPKWRWMVNKPGKQRRQRRKRDSNCFPVESLSHSYLGIYIYFCSSPSQSSFLTERPAYFWTYDEMTRAYS